VVKHEHEIERIAEEIQLYLFNHPNAADTLGGIARWWLTRQRYEEATSLVKKALDNLFARGLVAQSTSANDQHIYSKGETETPSTRTQ
jgi:hypothetical protein